VRTHACGARSSAGARLSPLLFIVKQVAPAELSAFFSFGSARKQIAPPARMRRFAPSCSRTSLRSSYLLPIVPWCACCGARLCPLLFTVKQGAPARMRRFAPSCSWTSLRSSYLLPIVPWCARCGARLSLLCHTCGALCFFPFGSARAPPARIRRFAHSCSRTSLRSSYLGARCRLAHSLFLSSSPSSSPFLRTPTSKCKNLRTPTSKRARARARI
jgi:hypothetical protein